ncbi:hypothetical protein [Hwangdonia sp.]|uniref:hypothetical protein n=1 Tax=Hwangdonia sp. TaxID=1883432 RepID=UPI003AB305F8
MRHIKDIIKLTIILLMVSCSNKADQINAFHTSLDSTDVDSVLTDYFDYPDEASKDNLKSAYSPLFNLIRTNISLGPYKVLKYKDAVSEWADVSKITTGIKPSKIYVVKYANNELLYVRLSGKKIRSLIPIQKGNVISGWL